jgi:PAS domain S-box-containing protein
MEEMYVKEDIPKLKEALEKCIELGDSSAECRMTRGDGAIRNHIIRFSALKDENAKVMNILGCGIDVTELRKREEDLEGSRVYFQNFFSASPVPLTLIGLDGTRLDCNSAMEKLTGRKKKELTGVPVEATYAKEEQPIVRKKLVDETIEKGYMYGFETYFLRPDGTRLPIVANCSLLRDKEGKPSAIIYSAADISELRKREEELKNEKAFSEFIIESSQLPIVVTDKDWKWIRVNWAFEEMFGFSAQEVLGKSNYEPPIWEPEEYKKLSEWVRSYLEKGGMDKYIDLETRCKTKDGKNLDMALRGVFVSSEVSKEIGFVGYLIDITELRKREKEQASAISSLSKVLGEIVKGDFTARVDTRGWSEELATIGMAINTLIETLEFEKKEKG